jgi:PilZ domain-containing protein
MTRLPQIEAEVTLSVPRRERVPASVARTGDGWVDLLLQATPSTPPSLLAQSGLFVEFVNDEGLCRLLGRKGLGLDLEPAGGWGINDVMRVDHDGSVQLLQARAFIRADVSAEVTLRHLSTGERQTTSTLDLSGGGALLAGVAGAREGDSLGFDIEMPEFEAPITGRLRIVRFTGAMHAGVQFTEISESDQGRLVRHVVNLQTAAREARRGGR